MPPDDHFVVFFIHGPHPSLPTRFVSRAKTGAGAFHSGARHWGNPFPPPPPPQFTCALFIPLPLEFLVRLHICLFPRVHLVSRKSPLAFFWKPGFFLFFAGCRPTICQTAPCFLLINLVSSFLVRSGLDFLISFSFCCPSRFNRRNIFFCAFVLLGDC